MYKAIAGLAALLFVLAVLAGCGSRTPASTSQSEPVAEDDIPAEAPWQEPTHEYVHIINRTGGDIWKLYIQGAGEEYEGRNILGGKIFLPGDTRTFAGAPRGTEQISLVLLAAFEKNGEFVEFTGEFKPGDTVEMHWGRDGETPTLTLVVDYSDWMVFQADLNLSNHTGRAITELYVTPSHFESWGSELLNGELWESDATVFVWTDRYGDGYRSWDFKIVDVDGETVIYGPIDIMEHSDFTLGWEPDGQAPAIAIG